LTGGVPVVAATDYVAAYPSLIAPFITAPYSVLGTDGFGRSDTRAALRQFFEVNYHQVVIAALKALADAAVIDSALVASAIARYRVATDDAPPWTR
jgi:pyruvate dehydrogenase E1 component